MTHNSTTPVYEQKILNIIIIHYPPRGNEFILVTSRAKSKMRSPHRYQDYNEYKTYIIIVSM